MVDPKKVDPSVAAVEKAVTEEAQERKKRDLKEEYNKQKLVFEEKQQADLIRLQQQMQAFERKFCRTDDKGNITAYPWVISDDMAKRGLEDQTTAYNAEWKNAMLSLLGSFAKMAEALSVDIATNQTAGTMVVKHMIKSAVSGYFNAPTDKSEKDIGAAALPTLMHNVTLDADNKLQVRIAKDNIPMGEDFNKLFTKLVEHWLDKNGYKPGQTPETKNQFFAEDGTKLTQAKMKELQEDDAHSLQSFLEERSSLDYQSSPTLNY